MSNIPENLITEEEADIAIHTLADHFIPLLAVRSVSHERYSAWVDLEYVGLFINLWWVDWSICKKEEEAGMLKDTCKILFRIRGEK